MSIKNLEKLSKQVEQVLYDEPESRNNDQYLVIRVWQRFYGVKNTLSVDDLYYLPSHAVIVRQRAKLQNNKHMYVPTCKEIAEKRKINMELWEQYLKRQNTPAY